MAAPEDHDFDENGNLRDISQSWSSYMDECERTTESDSRSYDLDEE